MPTPPDAPSSLALRLAQRAFAALLDRNRLAPPDVFAARTALHAIDHGDRARLARWLAWQIATRNPQALARIERVDARLGAQALHAHAGLPAGGRPGVSAPLGRTAERMRGRTGVCAGGAMNPAAVSR